MSPRRQDPERPPVEVDLAPAYELLLSIVTALEGQDDDDTYEIGAEWIEEVRSRAGEDLLARLRAAALDEPDSFVHLLPLAYDAGAPRDAAAFLARLRDVDPEEIRLHYAQYYSREIRRMTPATVIRDALAGDAAAQDEVVRTSYPEWQPWSEFLRRLFAVDAEQLRSDLAAAIEEWSERVWKPESLTILPILERDVEAKRDLMRELPMEKFIETATNGVEFVPRPGVERVVMVPSFVNRPLVSFVEFGEVLLIIYPVSDESVTALTDSPPLRLVRLSKALGDEKRLRILRALADGEKGLMELAEHFGLAKTTMHHHMIILRSAGLISVGVGTKRYRLRHEAIPDVGALLTGYLGAPATDPGAQPGQPGRRRQRAG